MSLPAVAATLTMMMGSAASEAPAQTVVASLAEPAPVAESPVAAAVPVAAVVPVEPVVQVDPAAQPAQSAQPVPDASASAGEPVDPIASVDPAASQAGPASPAASDPLAPAVAMPAPDPAATDATEDDQSAIVVTAQPATPGDPLEQINVESFKILQSIDVAVIDPVAKVYNKGLPRPVRQGLRNFFSNLGEPVVFAAYLLQFKPGKAAETAGRFVVNSTLGIGGLIDVAKDKPFNLPYRPNGLANTLGYYGVGPGPYMYLPLVGPTTVRDIIGDTVDKMVLPFAVGAPFTKPEVVLPAATIDALGERAAFDERINLIRDEDKPYVTYRELYLRQRQAEIDALHGRETPDVIPVYGPGMPTAGDEPAKPEEADQPAAQPPADQEVLQAPQPAPTVQPVPQVQQAPQ